MDKTIPRPVVAASADEEHELPCVEGLLAATLALMTGYADQQARAEHRPHLARKLSENLGILSEHALLSPSFRTVVWGLCQRWQRASEGLAQAQPVAGRELPSATARALWVRAGHLQ